jgi:UDP-N-acetylmuramate dehydrogenase
LLADKCIILSVTFKLSNDKTKINLEYNQLKTVFSEKGLIAEVKNVRDCVLEIRNSKLPDYKKYGNAGSFFKNPYVVREKIDALLLKYADMPFFELENNLYKIPAAWLLDQCGLKGKHFGGAEVYEKQPLIMINRGNAKPEDVLKLKDFIIESVNAKFEIVLEPEVRLV